MNQIQYQEEIDYHFGSASELQNAFNRSRQEIGVTDDRNKANELVAQGKFVVLCSYPIWCPCTDAYLDTAHVIEEVCDTRERAEEILSEFGSDTGDYDFHILPRVDVVVSTPPAVDYSDSPF